MMTSLQDICEVCNTSVFDALDLYYTFGFEKFPEPEEALRALRKCYKKSQLPYLKMESTGESENVLVSSAQELLKCKDGPKSYYIAYSLSQFVGIEEFGGEKPAKDKLSLTAIIAYNFLKAGETFQTLLLMPVAVLEEVTSDISCKDFVKYYCLIVDKKGTDTLKFMEELAKNDTTGLADIISDKMSKSVLHEKKQEKQETAKTVGKIVGKSVWSIIARKVQILLAPWAGIVTAIVAGVAAADAVFFVVGLIGAWTWTWFFAAIGVVGALYLIYGYWVGACAHPLRWLISFWLGTPATVIALALFLVNVGKALAGAVT